MTYQETYQDCFNEAARRFPSDCVVDAGCGPRCTLVVPHRNIIGVDIDHAALNDYGYSVCEWDLNRGYSRSGIILVSFMVLEHLSNARYFLSLLQADAVVLAFPHRNAHFAILNRFIPHRLKRWLLRSFHNQDSHRAYYQCCTGREVSEILPHHGYAVTVFPFWSGAGYYKFFKPLYHAVRWFEAIAERRQWTWAATHFVVYATKGE